MLTLPEIHTERATHVHVCNLALLRSLHTDTLAEWNLSLMVGEVGGCERLKYNF